MRGSESAHRSRASAQESTAEPGNSGRVGRRRNDRPLAAERTHRDDAEPELLGQRQNLALHLPLARVVGHLDRLDPAGAHHPGELVECARLPVGRADQPDAARGRVPPPAKAGTPRQATRLWICSSSTRPPKKPSCAVELPPSLVGRRRPDLRRDERLRRADRRAPGRGRPPPDRTSARSRRAAYRPRRRPPRPRPRRPPRPGADVEDLPGAEAHDRQARFRSSRTRAAPCESSMLRSSPWRPASSSTRPSSRSSGSTRGRAARTSPSRRFSPRARRGPTCGRSTASHGSSTTSATRPAGDRVASPRRARAPSSPPATTARRERRSCGGSRRTIRACDLQPEPFRAADRCEPHRPGADALRDVGGRPRSTARTRPSRSAASCSASTASAGEPELVAMSDDVCTGLQLVNFLQDPPARPRARAHLPAARGPPSLRRARAGACGPALGQARHAAAASRARRRRLCSDEDCRSRQPSAGGGVAPSPCSPGAGSPRSLRSSAPAGTSSRAARTGKGDLRVADAARARPAVSVDAAYAECTRITRREARNFAWGIMLLPRPKRLALSALYAYARRVDDIADGAEVDRRAACRARPYATAVRRAAARRSAEDPVMLALADAVVRYPVPKAALLELVDGALWDVDRTRYEHVGRAARVLPSGCRHDRHLVHGRLRAVRSRARSAARRDRSGWRCSRSTSCATSARTGRSGGSTCRTTSSRGSGVRGRRPGRGPAAPGVARAHGPPGLAGAGAACGGLRAARRCSTRAAPSASGLWRESTSACSTRSSDGSTTSSRPDRASRRSASSV